MMGIRRSLLSFSLCLFLFQQLPWPALRAASPLRSPVIAQTSAAEAEPTATRCATLVAPEAEPVDLHLPLVMAPAGGASTADIGEATQIVPATATAPRVPQLSTADPAQVAPPLDRTVVSTLFVASQFLYTGANPIQHEVTAAAIDPARVAVLRGRVITRDGRALTGVRVSVADQAEFGCTFTRADGGFDLVVNGGGLLTVEFAALDILSAQRTITVRTQEYHWLPDVALIGKDGRVNPINLGDGNSIQTAQGNSVSDSEGGRRPTLLATPGTGATMTLADGSTQPLDGMNVRITEYTVGPGGPAAMPATLPPNSAYTHALDFSVDEAAAAGGKDVVFDQPLYYYVENFLGFPAGVPVPAGYYDEARRAWVAAESGLVISILSINGGKANLDVDGSGQPAGAEALAALGITDAERQKLATLYTAGQSLWRVPVAHFSSWDFNWPFGPPDDAETPPGEEPESDDPTNSSCELPGSTIYCQDQVLGESIAVGGTPFTLHYASDRAPGRKAAFNLDIRLSGAQLPQSLKRIELEVLTAGQRFTQSFAPQPNLRTGYTWDGKDGYGRTLQGQTLATVRVGYTYDGVYQKTTRFGSNGNGTVITGSKTRQEITLWQVYSVPLGLFDARALGLGGWSLNIHHLYDAARGRLFLGNGERRDLSALPATLSTVSGNGMASHCGDGGPAVDACLFGVNDVAVAPDGSLYLADTFNERVRRIGPDGIITTVAGTGTEGYNGDTIPATSAQLRGPTAVAVGPDGSLYIADNFNQRVRRVDTAGLITTIAGTGAVGNDGDGGPATAATLIHLNDLAVAPDGALYLATGSRVRRIGPDGIITTVAGGGELEPAEADGGPAVDAKLFDVSDVALGPDGSLYLADSGHHRIRRVDTSGIISTVAGNGVAGFSGDGGPATSAQLKDPGGVAVSLTGNLYIADRYRVRLVSPEGTIRTVAGTGQCCSTVDRGPATALTTGARGLALGPEGHLYLADSAFYVRKLAATLPGQTVGETAVPAEDGSELYLFDSRGRHLRTLDPLTGAVRYQFGYTNSGYLATVTDGDGTVTTVERDGSGNPTALVGPDGQRTGLALGADGYLARVADALGNTTAFSYTSGGLLAAMTDARGGAYAFAYDGLGRLTKDTDPAGGFTALTIHTTPRGRRVDAVSSLGRTRSYALERLPTGETGVTNIGADGLATTVTISTSGVTRVNSPDGTQITLVEDANPRWGMIAPLPAALTVRLPSGLTYATTHQETVTLAAPDNPLSVTGASWTWGVNGRTYKNDYDGATRTYTFQSPAGRQSTATVDALGRVTGEQMLGLLPVSYGYDDRGRLTTISQGGRSFTLGYNDAGYPEQLTDPVGRTVTLSYDAAGRLTNQTLTGNRPLGVAYDAAGNLAALTPPDRSAHGFDYSPVGLVARYRPPAVNPNAGEVQYSYNADGELTRLTHADGQAVDFSYDNAGRLSSQSEPQGATTLAYDPTTGNLATISTPGGVNLAFAYDGFLLTSETLAGPVVGNVTWGYDNDLRVATTSVNGSNGVENQYDADGLLVSAGDLTVKRSPQTGFITGSTLASVETTQSFNGFGELSSYATTYNGAERYAVTYAHDSVGRITTLTETVESETHVYAYSYDAAGRLATVVKDGATVAGYTYDANGNRLSATLNGNTVGGTYDAQDRLLSYGGATYTYTANGELKTKSQNGATTGYSHDLFGNLLGVNLSSGTQIEYILDGRDRRVGKRVNGSLVQGFLYDGQLQIIAELDGNNSVVSRFVYGSRSTIPEYMIKGGVRYRIIADHLGSPRLVINTATGQVAQQLAYDAFGNVLLDTNPGFQPFGFAGGLYDRDTGLTHFGARDYDAATGRWTAKDPVGFQGGDANLYGYVLNDPVNAIDPTGQWAHVVAGALIGGGVDLLGQYLLNGGNFDCIDWGNVLFAAGLGALGGVVPRPFNSANQVISHWGGPLKPGAWVMTGKPGLRNWLLAGGPELVKKGPAYRLGQGLEYTVPKGTLKYPPGLEWFKGLFGQRIYLP